MKRRDFITLLGGAAAAWPLAARAQQAGMPVVGFLDTGSPEPSRASAFAKGLSEMGYADGRNVAASAREARTTGTQEAAASIGGTIELLSAGTSREIDAAFAGLAEKRVEALVVTPNQLFIDRRVQLATLAARYAVPTIFAHREIAEAGGLMSYATSINDQVRQVGIYVGRILKGEKPADLPVMQPTKFEFVLT